MARVAGIDWAIALLSAAVMFLVISLPFVLWAEYHYIRDHACYQTGETRTRTILIYNAALKMNMPQIVTEHRYECEDVSGFWS